MSSSRIIKAAKADSQDLFEFSFQQITRLPELGQADQEGGFLPMAIFDPTEVLGNRAVEQELPPEPPGMFITEEELDQKLRESFQNGLQEGKNLAERGLVNVFHSLRTATEGVHALREKVLRQSEDDVLNLVMMVARKVIQREVSHDHTILSDVIRAAIADVSTRDEITIRLHPEDHAQVTAHPEQFLHKELLTDRMQLKSDPTIPPASCQIDTEMGTIDAGLDAQLEEIFRHLLEARELSAEEV